VEAKARGLYVNTEFIDILQRMKEECKVFMEVNACSEREINARC
jgi:glutamine synthetase type III